MYENGWICLFKKITDWEWYQDCTVKSVFIHCLLKANYKEKKWQGITIERGEFVTSLASLSAELGLTISQVRTALDKLEKSGAIVKTSANKYTRVKCCNYSLYQDITDNASQTNHKQIANKSQSNDNQIATTNNNNNINKNNNNNNYPRSEKRNYYKRLNCQPSFDIEKIKQEAALNEDFDI